MDVQVSMLAGEYICHANPSLIAITWECTSNYPAFNTVPDTVKGVFIPQSLLVETVGGCGRGQAEGTTSVK